MFGRRGRESREAADREQSRRALFEELAKRPPDICPFLGLASSQTEYHDGFTREHRCYAFGDPVELSAEQQERVCLGRGYGNCPRYLRGVLVIPTEELEALLLARHPVKTAALGRGYGADSARAFDACFSASKSVSVLWALADDPFVRAEVAAAFMLR